jgi:hypothetical protein
LITIVDYAAYLIIANCTWAVYNNRKKSEFYYMIIATNQLI